MSTNLWDDDLCFICLENTDVDQHHTDYQENTTVSLCRSCHSKVHQTEGFYDHLKPDLSRKEATRNGHINEGQNGMSFSVYVKDDEMCEAIEKLLEENEYHNQSHLFLDCLRDHIDPEEVLDESGTYV
jgi:hypothetical protein